MQKQKCSVSGCNRQATTHKYGELCSLHYKRYERHGSVELPKKLFQSEQKCKYCDRKIGEKGGGARGMCNKHYQNWRRHRDPLFSDNQKNKLGSRGYRKRINGKDVHRKVMEDCIGRQLTSNEKVHHINLDKIDNRIENLFICNGQSEHSIIHRQLEQIASQLIESGIIGFKNGEYYICE